MYGAIIGLILFAVSLGVAYVTMSPTIMLEESVKISDSIEALKISKVP